MKYSFSLVYIRFISTRHEWLQRREDNKRWRTLSTPAKIPGEKQFFCVTVCKLICLTRPQSVFTFHLTFSQPRNTKIQFSSQTDSNILLATTECLTHLRDLNHSFLYLVWRWRRWPVEAGGLQESKFVVNWRRKCNKCSKINWAADDPTPVHYSSIISHFPPRTIQLLSILSSFLVAVASLAFLLVNKDARTYDYTSQNKYILKILNVLLVNRKDAKICFVMYRILKEFCPIPITISIETINLQIPDSLQQYFWIFHYFVWIFINKSVNSRCGRKKKNVIWWVDLIWYLFPFEEGITSLVSLFILIIFLLKLQKV